MTDDELIEWAKSEVETIYSEGFLADWDRLIALARAGAAVQPRPIKPDDKWILVELKADGKWDKEPIVLHKMPNGNWHSSGGELYVIGEDFENLVWPLPLSPAPAKGETE